jgi:hypothetical protein
MPTAAERNADIHDMETTLAKYDDGDQYHILLRLLLGRNPDKIPVKVDGRRMSSAEARRRLAMRKDRK